MRLCCAVPGNPRFGHITIMVMMSDSRCLALGHFTRKPAYTIWARISHSVAFEQQRHRPACTSAQSDHRLSYSPLSSQTRPM